MINVFDLNKSEQWDNIVKSFSNHDVYWLSGYVRAFQIHGDGEPLLIYYQHDNGFRGINVVMRRDVSSSVALSNKIAHGQLFDFITPYGYGGWLIEEFQEAIVEELFNEYATWCYNNSIVSEFVRFHPIIKNHEYCMKDYTVVTLGEVVSIDLSSPELIWQNFTSKNRNVIRKAKKNGVTVYNARTPQAFSEFMTIYNQTMDRDGAIDYYYFEKLFYESILNDLEQNAQVFFAVIDGKTIASSIIIGANGKLNYHLSGSLKEYGYLAPTNLILYKAALWGCANGYKSLYLGGGVGSVEDSLFKFKKAFYRGALNRFHIGKKVFMKDSYDELVDLGGKGTNDSFFPAYRTE